MSWSDGYVTEVEYTQGYYRELSPTIIDLALLSKGLARSTDGPLRYLELGFGQGLSLNIHAAAFQGQFWGTDFAAHQTVNARELATEGCTGARFENDGFAEFARRDDLPQFDVIGVHGIYSWISEGSRRAILDVVERRLAPGGIVYVSYNCPPGWAPAAPLQHLLSLHGSAHAGQDLKGRIEGAIAFAQQVADAGSRYFGINPQLAERLKDLRTKDWRYVAHEYFNAHWHPMPFSAVAEQMASVRCDFAASAHIMDHLEAANVAPAGIKLLAELPGKVLRETVRDYLTNQQFRRDIYIKGGRALTPAERNRRFADLPVALLTRPQDVKLEAATGAGKIQLRADLYQPFVSALAAYGYRPVTLGDLSRDPSLNRFSVDQIVEMAMTLIGTGVLAPARTPSADERTRCRALNDAIRRRSMRSRDHGYLASPVTGAGVAVSQVFQLFQASARAGADGSDGELVEHVVSAVRTDEPFRSTAPDAAKEETLRASLAKDVKTYRDLAPLYEALAVD